jgi:hypothetical protein
VAFSDEQLAKRLQNLATDRHLSGDAVGAKWLYEAAARLLELSGAIGVTYWHPSCDGISNSFTVAAESYSQDITYTVKNPWEDMP